MAIHSNLLPLSSDFFHFQSFCVSFACRCLKSHYSCIHKEFFLQMTGRELRTVKVSKLGPYWKTKNDNYAFNEWFVIRSTS